MFKINDRVLEVGTNVRGIVVDIDKTIDKPYGVIFEDVDEDKGVWWCDDNTIKGATDEEENNRSDKK